MLTSEDLNYLVYRYLQESGALGRADGGKKDADASTQTS